MLLQQGRRHRMIAAPMQYRSGHSPPTTQACKHGHQACKHGPQPYLRPPLKLRPLKLCLPQLALHLRQPRPVLLALLPRLCQLSLALLQRRRLLARAGLRLRCGGSLGTAGIRKLLQLGCAALERTHCLLHAAGW